MSEAYFHLAHLLWVSFWEFITVFVLGKMSDRGHGVESNIEKVALSFIFISPIMIFILNHGSVVLVSMLFLFYIILKGYFFSKYTRVPKILSYLISMEFIFVYFSSFFYFSFVNPSILGLMSGVIVILSIKILELKC